MSERLNKRVQEFDDCGQFVRVCIAGQKTGGSRGVDDTRLWGEPRGISTCQEDLVYVVDAGRQVADTFHPN